MRGVVPTGMKWNAVEWWNTAVHAPAFLLSPLPPSLFDSPPPLLSFFLFFPPSPLPLFNGAPHFSPFSVSPPFSLASYVRNEPQLIHHNRFTCTSAAATFTCLLPLSPMSLAFGPIRSSLLGSVGNIGCFHTAVRWNKDHRKCRISLRDFVQLSLRINLIQTILTTSSANADQSIILRYPLDTSNRLSNLILSPPPPEIRETNNESVYHDSPYRKALFPYRNNLKH